jgi:hypothetical protein
MGDYDRWGIFGTSNKGIHRVLTRKPHKKKIIGRPRRQRNYSNECYRNRFRDNWIMLVYNVGF